MTLKIAPNIRTSTENQRESIKLQNDELTSYSKSHNYEIYEKYIDFGFSGSTTERPALTKDGGSFGNFLMYLIASSLILHFSRIKIFHKLNRSYIIDKNEPLKGVHFHLSIRYCFFNLKYSLLFYCNIFLYRFSIATSSVSNS
jgi:hypothetical protein